MLSASELSQRARLGALHLHARYSGQEITANWRNASNEALNQRLLNEIDPDNNLLPEERAQRLEKARRAYFASLAWKSAQARRGKKGADRAS